MTEIGGKIAYNFAGKGWDFSKNSDISPINNSNTQMLQYPNFRVSISVPSCIYASMHL
jgi:hypothetical protein